MEYRNPGAVIEETIRVRMLKTTFGVIGKKQVLIDLGCGRRPYYDLYKPHFERTIGIEHPDTDFPKENIDIFCTADAVPLENGIADVILCTEVLHDIAEPDTVLREINRLLKPGGILILTTPFLVPVVDGKIDHYRYTRNGLTYIIHKSGMKVRSVEPVSDIFGVMTTLYVKPWLRIWNVIAKKTGWKGFYSVYNPLMWITAIFPQTFYLVLSDLPVFRQLFRKFNYGSIGYYTIAEKAGSHSS